MSLVDSITHKLQYATSIVRGENESFNITVDNRIITIGLKIELSPSVYKIVGYVNVDGIPYRTHIPLSQEFEKLYEKIGLMSYDDKNTKRIMNDIVKFMES